MVFQNKYPIHKKRITFYLTANYLRIIFAYVKQIRILSFNLNPIKAKMENADFLHSYTTEDQLNDGMIISADEAVFEGVRKNHFKCPVFLSAILFSHIKKEVLKSHSSYAGVLHDILFLASIAIAKFPKRSTLKFHFLLGNQKIRVFSSCEPFSMTDQSPVLKIFLPEEY